MAKIMCMFHEDSNPSMEVYENETETVGFCFVCNKRTILEGERKGAKKRPTDVPSVLEYISTLPVRTIRGFSHHYDDLGYYIIWPSRDFYKRRNFHDDPRYTAPRGIKSPIYRFTGTSKRILIVEGELNARSLYESIKTKDTIVSPGSAANLSTCEKICQDYQEVVIAVDHDPAGIVYGVTLKNRLLKLGKRVTLITCSVDYNETYCTEGPEAVRKHFERNS